MDSEGSKPAHRRVSEQVTGSFPPAGAAPIPRPRGLPTPAALGGAAPRSRGPLPAAAFATALSPSLAVPRRHEFDHPVAGQPTDRDPPTVAGTGLLAAVGRLWSGPQGRAAHGHLLDAWHASYSDQLTLRLARDELQQGRAQYLCLYPGIRDDRRQVSPATTPWHAVCRLDITAADDTLWGGTGWLAGPRLLITAGHCLWLSRHGEWAKRIEVRLPGSPPTVATGFRSVVGWTERLDKTSDYGAVLLADPLPGPYRAVSTSERDFTRESIAVVGYCSDRPLDTLWSQTRKIRVVQDRQLVYGVAVFGGVSGAPVLAAPETGSPAEDAPVVGIQQDGDFAGGAAIRITPAVAANIAAWLAESERPTG